MCVWMLCTGGLLRYAPAYTFFLKGCTPPKQAKRSSRLALFSVLDDDDGRPDDDLLSGLQRGKRAPTRFMIPACGDDERVIGGRSPNMASSTPLDWLEMGSKHIIAYWNYALIEL
jgi:hypothetical protein